MGMGQNLTLANRKLECYQHEIGAWTSKMGGEAVEYVAESKNKWCLLDLWIWWFGKPPVILKKKGNILLVANRIFNEWKGSNYRIERVSMCFKVNACAFPRKAFRRWFHEKELNHETCQEGTLDQWIGLPSHSHAWKPQQESLEKPDDGAWNSPGASQLSRAWQDLRSGGVTSLD